MNPRRWIYRLSGWLGLRGEVRECAQALPVLREQLQEASRQAETAIGNVCASFQSIADRSRETMNKATDTLGSGDAQNVSVEQSVETSQATIYGLLERMQQAAQFSESAISRMEEVEASVKGMEGLLLEVEKIAFNSKLVALNAKIEAVHVGALGAGFEVVADEISRQAARTNELTNGIAQRIQESRRCARSAAEYLRESVASESAHREQSEQEAEAALQVLVSVHQRARDSIQLMAGEHSRLQEELSKAVVNLQFQDRFAQRIGHVAEVLQNMEALLDRRGGPAGSRKSLLEGLEDAYSMHEERQVQASLLGAAPVEQLPSGEVELF